MYAKALEATQAHQQSWEISFVTPKRLLQHGVILRVSLNPGQAFR